MPDERIIQQVSGILGMNGIPFTTLEDGQSFLVESGSARVLIVFADRGDSTIVTVRAPLLEQVDGSGERKLKILEALNERNRSVYFGCFYYLDNGTIVVDHSLFGDQLQAHELMNALLTLAPMADVLDDELIETIGSGVRVSDVLNAAQAGTFDPGGAGPVVET